MKNLIISTLALLFIISCNPDNRYNTNIEFGNFDEIDSITEYEPVGPSYEGTCFIYKCYDSISKSIVYVDLYEHGYVGFLTNKIYVSYTASDYKILSSTSHIDLDSLHINFKNMPIDSVIFTIDESQIHVYTNKNDSKIKHTLYVKSYVLGLSENFFMKKKYKSAFIRFEDLSERPAFIKYDSK